MSKKENGVKQGKEKKDKTEKSSFPTVKKRVEGLLEVIEGTFGDVTPKPAIYANIFNDYFRRSGSKYNAFLEAKKLNDVDYDLIKRAAKKVAEERNLYIESMPGPEWKIRHGKDNPAYNAHQEEQGLKKEITSFAKDITSGLEDIEGIVDGAAANSVESSKEAMYTRLEELKKEVDTLREKYAIKEEKKKGFGVDNPVW